MFTEILDDLMQKKGVNKSKLSKESGIPYTTIDGWYKKGCDDIRLSTLKKLSIYFGVSLDYLMEAEKAPVREPVLTKEEEELIRLYRQCSKDDRKCALQVVRNFAALECQKTQEIPDDRERKEQLHEYLQESAKQYSQRERQDALNK